MYNQQVYYQNGGRSQVRPNHNGYPNPYNPRNVIPQQPDPPVFISYNQAQKIVINAAQGFLIVNQYQPETGDPMIVEQALFKGEVFKVGDKKK